MVPPALVAPQSVAPITEFETIQGLALRGDPHAMAKLGALYFNGEGVQESKPMAMVWFHRAAIAGEPYAMAVVGLIYAEGTFVPQNLPRAYEWLLKSVLGGDMQIIPTLWKVRNSLSPEELHDCTIRVLTELSKQLP